MNDNLTTGALHIYITKIYSPNLKNSVTVELLMKDHPHERPPAFYDHSFIDRMSALYKPSVTNDHPAYTTNDHGNLNFTPDERPAHFLT